MLRFIWRKESTFINAGQSGADGGVVQLIMTLAAQPLLKSLRNEWEGGVGWGGGVWSIFYGCGAIL